MINTALVYDLEIIKAIPERDGSRLDGYDYCEGWHDHANMGVSVIGAFDYVEQRYRVFCWSNFASFIELCAQRAPLLWQRGKIGDVIDYCLNDVRLTKRLFDEIVAERPLVCPKTSAPLLLRTVDQVTRTFIPA